MNNLACLSFGLICGCIGTVMARFIPEPILQDGIQYAWKIVFSGGVFSAMLFLFFEKVKGNTKQLLERSSLTGPEQIKLSSAIERRATFLMQIFAIILMLVGVCGGLHYLHTKGYYKPYLLYASVGFLFMTLPLLLSAIASWVDYDKTKRILDRRDVGAPDIE